MIPFPVGVQLVRFLDCRNLAYAGDSSLRASSRPRYHMLHLPSKRAKANIAVLSHRRLGIEEKESQAERGTAAESGGHG